MLDKKCDREQLREFIVKALIVLSICMVGATWATWQACTDDRAMKAARDVTTGHESGMEEDEARFYGATSVVAVAAVTFPVAFFVTGFALMMAWAFGFRAIPVFVGVAWLTLDKRIEPMPAVMIIALGTGVAFGLAMWITKRDARLRRRRWWGKVNAARRASQKGSCG
ncbi:MAG: hypothetical protein Q7R85_03060 [bacterium]|nr:hypothetical protein [bacterium]